MRILLINPSFKAPKYSGYGISFPLGLGYLAASVKNAGFEIVVVDSAAKSDPVEIEKGILRFGLDENQLRDLVKSIQPGLVGIGCFFSSRFPAALETAKIVKNINNNIITVIGGIHPSIMPAEVCSRPEIDFAIIGEGEQSFIQLIESIISKNDFTDIDGLAFKRHNKVIINPKTQYIKDLDNLSYPAWDMFDMERYLKLGEGRWGLGRGRYAPIVTSRSCPYRCTFCGIHNVMGRKYRSRSASNVLDEIETLIDKYHVNELSFEDDNLTYDKNRFNEICNGIIKRKLKIKWNTPNGVHVGSLDKEALELAKESGCDSLNLAIESGDDYIRNRVIRKGLKAEKIYEVAIACRKVGIKANAYFIIGMPGESDSSVENTKKYIRDLKFNNVSIFIATPMPGTRLYDDCLANGYIDKSSYEDEFVNYKAALFTQASIQTPEFDRQKLQLWQHCLFIEYFKATLRDNFFRWLFTMPRTWAAMTAKVIMAVLLSDKLSFKLTKYIRKLIKK